MTGPQTLAEFYETLDGFIRGTNAAAWRNVAQYFHGRAPKSIIAIEESQIAERCWQLLSDSHFDQGIISFYNPGGWRDEYDHLAQRLARNAKGLFAAAMVAATARQTTNQNFTNVFEWCCRAVGALGSIPVSYIEPPKLDNLFESEALLSAAFEALSPYSPTVAAAHLWSLYYLGIPASETLDKRRTWIAWANNGASGSGTIEVAETELQYRAIVEHAETALLPAEREWLDSLEQAWKISGCAKENRTFSWTVRLQQPWLPLARQSAGVAFYVALSCLRTDRPCDPSRAVLASLPAGGGSDLRTVRSVEEKISALPTTVRLVGLADGQIVSSDHSEKEIVNCASLEAAVDFISDFITKVRSFLVAIKGIDLIPEMMGGPYMEPILQAASLGMRAEKSGDSDGVGSRINRGSTLPARVLINDLLTEPYKRVIILGDGGFGKTLLVKEAARSIASSSLCSLEQAEDSPSTIRLVLPLEAADIAYAIDNVNSGADKFDDSAVGMILEQSSRSQYPTHSETVHYIIRRAMDRAADTRVLITVDNLDRLAAGSRDRVFAVLRQIATWSCSILLTSREYAFEPEDLPTFDAYRIRELTPTRARRHAAEILTDDPVRASVVSQLLTSDQNVTLLARSPLLLGMICHAARRASGNLLTRTGLYRDYLLQRLGFQRDPLGAESRFELLHYVASKWFETVGPVGEVEAKQLASWIGGDNVRAYPLTVHPEDAHSYSPSALMLMLLENLVSLGIFVPITSARSSYRASHPSLIEYLAGVSLSSKIDGDGSSLIEQVAADAIEPKWRDIIPFVAGSLKDPAPLLSEILSGPDPFYLRLFVVANCLAEISSPIDFGSDVQQVSSRLVDLLRSPSKTVRRSAIDALGRMGIVWGSVIDPLLVPLLSESDADVRASAVETACALTVPNFVDIAARYLVQFSSKYRDEVLRRLAAIAPGVAAASAKTLLDDPDLDVRSVAAEILVTIDGKSYRNVIEQLKMGDGWSRRIAARALALSEDHHIVGEIRNLFSDDSPAVRAAAVQAVTELRPAWQPKDWTALATDESAEVRLETTRASTVGLQRLRLMLSDSDERVVLGAIEGLLSSGYAISSDLEPLLSHKTASVRMKAAEASCRLGNPSCLDLLLRAVIEDSDATFFALAALESIKEPESVEPLLEILPIVRSGLQLKIIGTLARLGDKRATVPLVTMLQSADTAVQRATVAALGRIADKDAFEPLNSLVQEGNATLRRAAVNALAKLRDPRALESLLDCLKFPDRNLIVSTASAIKSCADFPRLLTALDRKGGPYSFALSCPMPWVVYDILYSYIAISPRNLWLDRTLDFADLTVAIHEGPTALAH